MPYVEGRVVHDADSHLMELGDCLDPYLTAPLRAQLGENPVFSDRQRDKLAANQDAIAKHTDPEFRANVDDNIMLRKNQEAHGAFIAADRPHALDLMGFASQLVFTTFCLGNFGLDQGDDRELCYAVASAHNRMMTDFCAVDQRFLATAYIPLEDFALARACAEEAVRLGAKALMVPSWCPQEHAPSHVGLDPVWALAEEAGLPVVFHVGGEDKLNPVYKENGLAPVKDFHGGDDNFTSVSYMPIPNAVMQTAATLIFDGVFDRFPSLKWAAIELGAAWVPGWMRAMDSAAHAFIKNEERLQKLSARPSEIVSRQFRAAPYPHEDAGWIIANAGPDVAMFSSDYPHIEGGRNPLKRFADSLRDTPAGAADRFYCDNFIDLMGAGLAPELHRPAHLTAA
jgi:predicted TIM-barrel fold metal-dependent hydrolase